MNRQRHKLPPDSGHRQLTFDFVPDTALPNPRLEPDPASLVRVDNFLLHPTHAERLEAIRKNKYPNRPKLDRYIKSVSQYFFPEEFAGET